MKQNYIDGKGNYHNEQNLTLAQIYDSGVEFGCKVTAIGIIEELEKIKQEIQSIIALADSRGEDSKLAYQCQIVINERISELKGEADEEVDTKQT